MLLGALMSFCFGFELALIFSFFFSLKVFSRLSLEELEAFITEQEKLASGADPEEGSPEHGQVLDVRLREKHELGTNTS